MDSIADTGPWPEWSLRRSAPADAPPATPIVCDDTLRAKVAQTIADLNRWAVGIAPFAMVETAGDELSWQMVVAPCAPGACSLELVLRYDQQFDLALDGEIYEDRAIDNFALFLQLAEAVADGRITRRLWVSTATELPCKVETIVKLVDGGSWRGERGLLGARLLPEPVCEWRDRHYVPYGRPERTLWDEVSAELECASRNQRGLRPREPTRGKAPGPVFSAR